MADKPESIQDLFGASALFEGVAERTVREILPHTRRLHADPGQLIVIAGQKDDHLYLVGEGTVRLAFVSPKGQEKTVARLNRMKSFGLAELFSGRPFRYNVEAVDKTDIVSIPGRTVRAASARDDALQHNLLLHMSRHFDALAQDIEYTIRYNALQRVVSYLLGTAGADPEPGVRLTLPMRKNIVASRLGLTPETFSRSLMNLTDRGLIRVEGRHITLENLDSLQELLEAALFE